MHAASELWEEAGEPEENPCRRRESIQTPHKLWTCPLTYRLFFLVMPNIVCEHLFIVHSEWSSSWPSPRLLGDSPRSLECATLWFENVVSLRSVMLLARSQMQHNCEVNHSLNWNIVNRWKDYHNYAGCQWRASRIGLSKARALGPVQGRGRKCGLGRNAGRFDEEQNAEKDSSTCKGSHLELFFSLSHGLWFSARYAFPCDISIAKFLPVMRSNLRCFVTHVQIVPIFNLRNCFPASVCNNHRLFWTLAAEF